MVWYESNFQWGLRCILVGLWLNKGYRRKVFYEEGSEGPDHHYSQQHHDHDLIDKHEHCVRV
jgi:hypothetical protein